jgi:hypothetical protein
MAVSCPIQYTWVYNSNIHYISQIYLISENSFEIFLPVSLPSCLRSVVVRTHSSTRDSQLGSESRICVVNRLERILWYLEVGHNCCSFRYRNLMQL